MGAYQRRKGHRFELRVISLLKHIFPKAVSARAESRNADARGIDIVNTGDLAIQCKSYSSSPNYHKLISQMKTKDIPVVFHQKTERAKSRFMVRGEYCILRMEDFIEILEKCQKK